MGQVNHFEFSRRTREDHWAAGYRDAHTTLSHPEVLTPPAGLHAVQVFDFTSPSGQTAAKAMKESTP